MTPDQFRKLALALPEAEESEHMQHPDFRVRKKIFSTLGPAGDWGMVKLTPEQQAAWMESEPEIFEPAPGAWGERGYTRVLLLHAQEESVKRALVQAWFNTAPRGLAADFEDEL